MAVEILLAPIIIEVAVIGEVGVGKELEQLFALSHRAGPIAALGIGRCQIFPCSLRIR
ncbi:hypothetical protein D3C72_2318900 [compost metagenome]